LTYSSAGHNPPRLLRVRERSVTPLDGANAMPLGIIDEPSAHTEETIHLMPGDLALLYTDGITEARSPADEFFGAARLDEILRALPEPAAPDSAIEAVMRAVGEFAGAGPLSDDQTLLAFGRCAHTH
jgi:sigma-B regulation protein RsbU (phosphoserine phosphatase)